MAEWSGRPAYQQVAQALRDQIRAGSLRPGTQLPSLADLMQEHRVSSTVVRMALAQLRADGLIVSHQGKGSFVQERDAGAQTSPAVERGVAKELLASLDSLQDRLRQLEERVSRLEDPAGRGVSKT
ncbi:hypothetical protein GCM10012275_55180 [Longimycelium tulufanense]|uniref:HTH gntR-type domain-containing protein n=1 Tax=Longimycelium tulufanense TaxID=907463 RepID=A0A8J3FZ55_9PSEU|nr:hypothetical protein GCM10012275_55180 [Longimycelium tulufanense]